MTKATNHCEMLRPVPADGFFQNKSPTATPVPHPPRFPPLCTPNKKHTKKHPTILTGHRPVTGNEVSAAKNKLQRQFKSHLTSPGNLKRFLYYEIHFVRQFKRKAPLLCLFPILPNFFTHFLLCPLQQKQSKNTKPF